MTSLFPFRPVSIAPFIIIVLGACGVESTPADNSPVRAQKELPADSSALLTQQKMYLSFEVTLKGERKFGERVPVDALADIAWRINRSVKGEMVLDMPLPGSIPPSIASDGSVEMMEEGRFIGWMAAPPDDPDFMEKMMTGDLDVARNPMFVPVEFQIDDEVHRRSRDFPSQPFGTTHDETNRGCGKAYISKDSVVSCDLKRQICDIVGLLESGYSDGTDLVAIAEMSSYPGDQGKSSTMGPDLMLPKISEALGKRLAGIGFESSGPITTSFSEPYRGTNLINVPVGEEPALIVTVNVTVSPKPAVSTTSARLLDAARMELAPTCKLRAGMNLGNTLFTTKDPATGELRGVSVDIMRELASRLGVPVEFIVYATPGEVADDAQKGTWDVAILAIEPSRAKTIAFSPPNTEVEATYAVHKDSPLHSVEQVDASGIRISAQNKAGYELYLTRTLRNATLVRPKGFQASIQLFNDRGADAVAGLRPMLLESMSQMPDARLVEGRFMVVNHGLGIPRERTAAAEYLKAFVQEMNASGFIARSIERHGIEGLSALE